MKQPTTEQKKVFFSTMEKLKKSQKLAQVMVAQHKHQYRFFETYGIFRGRKLAEGCKYDGDWSEGLFLYNAHKKDYEMVNCLKNV